MATDKTMVATENKEAIEIKVVTEIIMAVVRETTETAEMAEIEEATVEVVAIRVTTKIEREMTIGMVVVKEVTKTVNKDLIVTGLIDKMIEDQEMVAIDLAVIKEMDMVEMEPWTETLATEVEVREEVAVAAVAVDHSEEGLSNLLWQCHKIQKTQRLKLSKS